MAYNNLKQKHSSKGVLLKNTVIVTVFILLQPILCNRRMLVWEATLWETAFVCEKLFFNIVSGWERKFHILRVNL